MILGTNVIEDRSNIPGVTDSEINGYPFDPYVNFPSSISGGWYHYLVSRYFSYLDDDETELFSERVNGHPLIMSSKVSGWDEENFGFKVAHLSVLFCNYETITSEQIEHVLRKPIERLASTGVKVISARIHSDNLKTIHALETAGFRIYEAHTYSYLACGRVEKKTVENIRLMQASDLDRVATLARENNFDKSHFHLDERFDAHATNSMYSKWVMTAWERNDPVLILETGTDVAGFFALTENKDLSKALGHRYFGMRSLALDSKYHGRGYGTKLFQGSVQWMKKAGAEFIETSYASRNHLSAALHGRCGFQPVCEAITLHKWL